MDARETLVTTLTGHTFRDPDLLRCAFTHPSWSHEHPGDPHYQRLEFLGDAVVGLCTTRLLFARWPDLPEGGLNDLRQRVVNTRALGETGADMGLAPHVRLGASEARKRSVEPKILGDVVEAMLGALFEDGGLQPCQDLVTAWLGPRIDQLASDVASDVTRNAKNRLQELTQADGRGVPEYEVTWEGPDHDRRFFATAIVDGVKVADGDGRTKKEAEIRAARLALVVLARSATEEDAS